jgi:NADH dehydrogenase FAD-containing subunit
MQLVSRPILQGTRDRHCFQRRQLDCITPFRLDILRLLASQEMHISFETALSSKYDLIIVGAGLAGITLAIECEKKHRALAS